MAESVSQAVAVRDNPMSGFVAQYRKLFADTLPSHLPPDAFVRLAQGVLRRNPNLTAAAKANPDSFLHALLDCARLGHEPGTDAYALTVRDVKQGKDGPKKPTIIGIEQYQGVIERMYRAGAALSVKCEVVRANDVFDWKPTRMRVPLHEYNALSPRSDRGDLVGVYAYAEMQGGAVSRVVVMAADEVAQHKALAGTDKFWDEWPDAMWRKTALHELEKWVPTSSEYLRQRAEAAATVAEAASRPAVPAAPEPSAPAGDVVDGQLVDTPPAEPPWPEVAEPGSGGGKS